MRCRGFAVRPYERQRYRSLSPPPRGRETGWAGAPLDRYHAGHWCTCMSRSLLALHSCVSGSCAGKHLHHSCRTEGEESTQASAVSADAHDRWPEGQEDGRRGRQRTERDGSLVPPEIDFEAKAQDVPPEFRCVEVLCKDCWNTGRTASSGALRPVGHRQADKQTPAHSIVGEQRLLVHEARAVPLKPARLTDIQRRSSRRHAATRHLCSNWQQFRT